MSIKIGIVSPSRRQGETTLTMLLGLALEKATGETVCITATGADYLSTRTYLGVEVTEDITKSASQLNQLLESGVMTHEGFKDYLTALTPKTDVLLSSTLGMSEGEGDRLFGNALPYLTHEYIVTDINSSLDAELVRHIYDEYDFIIVVFSQDAVVIKKLNTWMKSGAYPETSKVGYVLNGYSPIVSDARTVAKNLGIKYAAKFTKLALNPYIRKMGNEGKIIDLLTYITKKDTRTLEVFYDLGEILQMLSVNLCFAIDWGTD